MAATAALLVYGTWDMDWVGNAESPTNTSRIAKGFIAQDVEKATSPGDHPDSGGQDTHHGDYFHGHVPNMVTSVIVTYRGYDTMFELAVIFIAGFSTVILLRRRPRPNLRRNA